MSQTTASGVWVVGEQKDGQMAAVTLELLTTGRWVADSLKQQLTVVMVGNDLDSMVGTLEEYGPDRIILISGQGANQFIPEVYSESIAVVAAKTQPSVMLFPATYDGRDLAARLAAKLGVGLAADCTDVSVDDEGRFVQVRPAFGGNLMAVIHQPVARPQLATLRPHITKPAKAKTKTTPVIEHANLVGLPKNFDKKVLKTVREVAEESGNLDEAEVVIGIGRGLGSVENIKTINRLAVLLKAAVGGSRGVVDAGWLPHSQQIGLTGRVISPKMYMALGISGAVQHLVGVRTAKEIVAINIDPEAPIFKVATYGIVGDLFSVLPTLIRELESQAEVKAAQQARN
ncbi:MAG: electron transfer flavoprotein subunit alpha/FixB family protein [Candidatus Bathyarchaeia archaeon]|jgi:electron transfer flavoprotein alpha subunit